MTTANEVSEATDDQWVAALIAGGPKSQQAFEALHDRYARIVLAVVAAKLRDGASSAAADVSQKVWLKVWQKAGTSYRDQGQFRSWLLTVAKHEATDELRRKRPVQIGEDHDVKAQEDAADQAETQLAALRDCISRLDGDRRRVIELWLEQKSHEEIAAELQIAAGTSMSRLGRAKDLLRDCVQSKLP